MGTLPNYFPISTQHFTPIDKRYVFHKKCPLKFHIPRGKYSPILHQESLGANKKQKKSSQKFPVHMYVTARVNERLKGPSMAKAGKKEGAGNERDSFKLSRWRAKTALLKK